MARKHSSWRSTGRRIGKTLGRKSPARRRNNFVRSIELGVERLEPRWVLSAGALDTTFDPIDHDGVLIGNLGLPATADVRINAVVTQADGKIIAAGIVDPLANNQYDNLVARFNSDGSLDTTFGVGGAGFTTFDFSISTGQSTAQDVTLDSAGRIIVVGDGPNASNLDSWTVARLTSSGVLDTSFNGTGKVVTTWTGFTPNVSSQAHGVAVQSDGKIVVVGDVRNVSFISDFDWGIARYNTDGTLDSTFGTGGKVTEDFYGARDVANDVKIQSDGRIVVAGYARNGSQSDNFAVARFNTNGTLDSTFGSGGMTDINVVPTAFVSQDQANSLSIQSDGRIVLTGFSNVRPSSASTGTVTDYSVARFLANGTLDTTYDPVPPVATPSTPGTRRVDFGGNDISEAVGIQVDGQDVIAGSVTPTTGHNDNDSFGLARLVNNNLLLADGSLDSTFGSGGEVQTRISDYVPGTIGYAFLTDMALQPDGKIVATGYVLAPNGHEKFVIARYESGLATQTIAGPADINEGQTYTLTLSSNDPTTSQWTINWGNGTQVVPGNPTSVTHVYADGPNSYTISATVTTVTGTTPATNTVAVTVHNVAPTLAISGASDVNEGSAYTLNLSSSDPGADTINQWTINWGDGTQVVSGNPSSVSHTYADGNASRTISATATDEDGTFAAGNTVNVAVHNVAPTLAISGAADVNEGSAYTLNLSSFDPGTDTISQWSINWGDGTQIVSGNPASVSHTYADGDAGYTISATATDEDGTYSAGNTVGVAVHNVAPTLTISGASDVNEGALYTLNLSSFDPGADTIAQWTINWGDGTQVVSGNPSSATHTYADGTAAYSISATATDEDGTFSANSVNVTVHDVAPTLAISGAANVNEGSGYTLNLSSFDPGSDTISQWAINWGDTTQIVSGNPSSVSHTYADGDANYTISATATNEDGTYAAGNTVLVAVLNVAPTLAISGAADVDEASSYTLNLSSFDPGADTITQWTINWGDSSQIVSGNPSSITHTYADGDASYTISATATDEDGTFAAGNTVGVTVHNVAPTLTISGASDVNEGSGYTLNLSSFDPGVDTISQWSINWGDGSQVVSGSPTSVSHTYADGDASYTISATATDEDGTFAAGNTVGVMVHNVAPTVSISGTSDVNEGSAYTLNLSAFDPGADTISQWTINWGDGSQVVSSNPTSVSHTYADGDASYSISATATDEDGTFAAGNTVAVAVHNVAPTLGLSGASSVNEGSSYTLGLSSFDPGADTINQWTIDWGDGTQVVTGNPSNVAHTYADGSAGYTISATATDEDGTYAAGNTVGVTVNNVAPTLTISGASSVNEGSSYTLNLSRFDPGADTISQWNINWGDSTQVVVGNPSSVSHTYADGSNAYTISATATDEDGTFVAGNTVNVTVNNVAPTLAISGAASVDEGSSYTLNLSESDPGADTVNHWTINWGDSTQVVAGNPASVAHTYADGSASYTISSTATDEDGTFAAGNTVGVTVNNVAPTLAISGAASVNEGSSYTLNLSKSDPGNDTIDHWTINWGDSTQVVSGHPASATHVYPNGPANYTISAIATDEDGTYAAGNTVAVTVNNVAPAVGSATFTLVEHSPNGTVVGAVTAHDPGTDTLSFSIVGGTGTAAFAINSATGQITVTNGSLLDFNTTPTLTLNVQVSDGDGGIGSASVTINLTRLASIGGVVFVDVNHNGLFDANEPGISGIDVKLLDQNGNAVLDSLGHAITATTGSGGFYLFQDLQPGTYQVSEVQPTGVTDGSAHLGSLGGTILGIDRMQLTLAHTDAYDYAFAEYGQQLRSGDTAGIGFWQNKNGQALITQGGTQLATWLTTNFSNIFGNSLAGASGADVASFYRDQLFKGLKLAGPAKVDAQFMATALATFFTSRTLAGGVAAAYGFNVTDTGIGTKIVNVGTKGAAFNVANGSDRTIMQLLLATNSLTDQPNHIAGFAAIYDTDGNAVISSAEASMRTMANDLYSSINESGGI